MSGVPRGDEPRVVGLEIIDPISAARALRLEDLNCDLRDWLEDHMHFYTPGAAQVPIAVGEAICYEIDCILLRLGAKIEYSHDDWEEPRI